MVSPSRSSLCYFSWIFFHSKNNNNKNQSQKSFLKTGKSELQTLGYPVTHTCKPEPSTGFFIWGKAPPSSLSHQSHVSCWQQKVVPELPAGGFASACLLWVQDVIIILCIGKSEECARGPRAAGHGVRGAANGLGHSFLGELWVKVFQVSRAFLSVEAKNEKEVPGYELTKDSRAWEKDVRPSSLSTSWPFMFSSDCHAPYQSSDKPLVNVYFLSAYHIPSSWHWEYGRTKQKASTFKDLIW